jgi:hypothetical protein
LYSTPGNVDGKREVLLSITFLTTLRSMRELSITVTPSFPIFPHCYIFFLILSIFSVLFCPSCPLYSVHLVRFILSILSVLFCPSCPFYSVHLVRFIPLTLFKLFKIVWFFRVPQNVCNSLTVTPSKPRKLNFFLWQI